MEGVSARVSSPHVVGREAELAALAAALESAAAGRPSVVFLGGDSGIGKSRLLLEFAGRSRAAGVRVLAGDCVELGDGELPFAPIVAALRPLPRELGDGELAALAGASGEELSVLLPELGTAAAGFSAGEAGQARLFELLLGLLGRLAEQTPLALVLEDIHWADRSTRDLLAFLVRNLREERIVIVASYRTDELHRRHPLRPFLAQLESSRVVERRDLGPFTREEAAEQLAGILGERPEPGLAERLHERAEGNPLYIEELASAAADGCADLPWSLQDAFMLRVERLSESGQALLRAASALGRLVDQQLLEQVAGVAEHELDSALREAVAHQLLVVRSDGDGVEFRHALLREAVHAALLPGERRRLHHKIAEALARRPEPADQAGAATRAAEVAHHWYVAHDVERALPAALAAGEAAARVHAYPEAQRQYERAIELWEAAPREAVDGLATDRVDALRAAARAAEYNGEHPRAVALARAALDELDEAADPHRAALILERLGRYLWLAGEGEESLTAYRRAIDALPPDPPTSQRAKALAGEGAALMLCARYSDSAERCREAIQAARAAGADYALGQAKNTLGVDLVSLGHVEEGFAELDEARRIAERDGAIDAISRAFCNGADARAIAGRHREAVEIAEAGYARFSELGLGRSAFGTWLALDLAYLHLQLGDVDEAERRLLRESAGGGTGTVDLHRLQLAAEIALTRGDVETARARLAEARPLAGSTLEVQWTGPLRVLQAFVELEDGHIDEARAAVREGLDLAEISEDTLRRTRLLAAGVQVEADAAERARAFGDTDAERTAVEAGEALLRTARELLAERPPLPGTKAAVAEAAAEATRLRGVPDPDAWVEARERWDRQETPIGGVYARWREAEAAVAGTGDRERATETLRVAREAAERCGFTLLRSQIDALARRARLDLGGDGAPGGAAAADELGLTPREREVLLLVADGRTNRQIAEKLFMSEKTASVHVSRILAKLGVRSRVEAAAVAHRAGIVEPV